MVKCYIQRNCGPVAGLYTDRINGRTYKLCQGHLDELNAEAAKPSNAKVLAADVAKMPKAARGHYLRMVNDSGFLSNVALD